MLQKSDRVGPRTSSQAGENGGDLPAYPARVVQVVDHQVEEDAPGLRCIGIPAVWSPLRSEGEASKAQNRQRPNAPFDDGLPRSAVFRCEAKLMSHPERYLCALERLYHAATFGSGQAQR